MLLVFFPEAIPAALIALYSPIWAIRLLGNGEVLQAMCLLVGDAACVYGFIQGCKQRSTWLAYACMMGPVGLWFMLVSNH